MFSSSLCLFRTLFILAGIIASAATLVAQQTPGSAVAEAALPDAPSAMPAEQPVSSSDPQKETGSASVSGFIVDSSGAAIANAHVLLLSADGRTVRDTRTSTSGEFRLETLPTGTFRVVAGSTGFAATSSGPITLADMQAYVVPTMTLAIATSSSEVRVLADDPKIADLQIKAAEQQRVLGIVPNFYTSYVYDAVRLTPKQKYSFAFRETLDPTRFIGTSIAAGIEQWNGSYAGYGDDLAGYGKRYAAVYGDGLFSDILSHAVYPVIFKQDPRYFFQGTGTNKSRFVHAVSFAVAIRSDSGQTVPNYSYLMGDLTSAAISNLYYPHADRGVSLVFTNAAYGLGRRAAGSLVSEFLLPHLTSHKAGGGKP